MTEIEKTKSDTPKMIEYCLNCKWAECWNCLGLNNRRSIALRVELGGVDDRDEGVAIKGEKA